MFTTVKLSTSLPIGAVVSFNQQTSTWSAAQDASQLIGIVSTAPFEQDGQWLAGVTFAGTCFALASRAIAPEGGGSPSRTARSMSALSRARASSHLWRLISLRLKQAILCWCS